jgi:hypothetical protein
MATVAVMVKNETALIAIDKLNRLCTIDVTSGTKDAVTFHADENCVLRFKNLAVFGREYLPLKKDEAEMQRVMSPNEVTTFEVFLPVDIENPFMGTAATSVTPFSRVWPIVP